MYGIFTNICPKNHPNVGKYTIHGAYGFCLTVDVSMAYYDMIIPPEMANIKQDFTTTVGCKKGWLQPTTREYGVQDGIYSSYGT